MRNIYTCYPEGRFKALTMSYDDGVHQDRRLISLFNRTGIKGTFHINSGLFIRSDRIPPEEIREIYRGHEVAAHTLTHPTISRCPDPLVAQQILEDRKGLESIVGYPVRGMSYPNGSHSASIREMLPALGIAYSRVVGNSGHFEIPEDWTQWMATCHHKHRLMELGELFRTFSKKQYLKLMYVWGHSYEFDHDNNWGLIEEFCEKMGHQPDIWYATNIEIHDYLMDARRLQFTAVGDLVRNPSSQAVWISVDDNIVRIGPGEMKPI